MLRLALRIVVVAGVCLWTTKARSQTVHTQEHPSKTKSTTTKTKNAKTTDSATTPTNTRTTNSSRKKSSTSANRQAWRARRDRAMLARIARSQAWALYHHRHWHTMWDVRFRMGAWNAQQFADHGSAASFYQYLRMRGFERLMSPTSGGWTVQYRSPASGTYGTYVSLPIAGAVQSGLRQLGFHTWLHSRSVYRAY